MLTFHPLVTSLQRCKNNVPYTIPLRSRLRPSFLMNLPIRSASIWLIPGYTGRDCVPANVR
jgi:hypothetical protein